MFSEKSRFTLHYTANKILFFVNTTVCIYVIWFTNRRLLSFYFYHLMDGLDESQIDTVAE